MGGIVLGVMLILLFLAFGSAVLPIKAIVMNAVSITASFGIVTWIFQDGHLSGLLGFEAQGYLDATNPILMLAILFGLSMDYEVFLLSRVREQWDKTHDNNLAVADRRPEDRPDHHQRRAAAGRGDRRVRSLRHRLHEDDRHRHAGRADHRRDRRPCPARPRDDEACSVAGTGGLRRRCSAGGRSTAGGENDDEPASPAEPELVKA